MILLKRWIFDKGPPFDAVNSYLHSVSVDAFEVVLAGIPFIRYPVVVWETVVKLSHYPVSVDFCDNACRRYAKAFRVPLLYERLLGLHI